MSRRSKIVCTLGPASSDPRTIQRLIAAGMDVVRLNFSHGSHASHERVINLVREAAALQGKAVPILQDLQGPKIRVGPIENGEVELQEGQRLILTSEPVDVGTVHRVQISYEPLPREVVPGGRILIDDGMLELQIISTSEKDVVTEVLVGGPLKSRKGVNLPELKTSTPALTAKDKADLNFGLRMELDLIALSFVRDATDVRFLANYMKERDADVPIIAKIEKPEAVNCFDQILEESDGIMVARGDLGIEMPLAKVPATQKMIIEKCRASAKPVITATQMLESMIDNPRPTRAEASDVANAVFDGSDALMLSGETAVGSYAIRTVEVMGRIIEEAEGYGRGRTFGELLPSQAVDIDQVTASVSFTAWKLAEQIGARAIVCITSSGTTARAIARHRPSMPLYAFTDNTALVEQLGLVWGTKAFSIPFQPDTDHGVKTVRDILVDKKLADPGDLVVLSAGMPLPSKGHTNMVHVSQI